MVLQLADLDQSHDWDGDTDVAPDPHSSGLFCLRCRIYVCIFCTPQENEFFDLAITPCDP